MRLRSLVGVFALAMILAFAAVAPAQTLTAFNIERTIALNNILTTITPQIPSDVLAALAGGALEIREVLIYNPQANTITSTVFVVPTGSPIPTPAAALANLGTALVQVATTTIDKIYVTTKPFQAVTFVGTVSQSTATPYGNYLGATSTISAGYTSDTPPKITTVVETVSGALAAYSPAATVNTFTIVTPPAGGGGGGGGTAPTVVITPANQTVLGKEVSLDASKSTDPNGLALTFQWTAVGNAPNVSLLHGNSAIATAQLGANGPNTTYTFQVTVTDSAGNTASGTTTITYVGR
jgi:hypothetical protein